MKNKLGKRYDYYFLEIRKIINELDPVGLVNGTGAPEDEHDYITSNVLSMLTNDETEGVSQFIIKSYDRYGFGFETLVNEYKESFLQKIEETTIKIMEVYKEMKHDEDICEYVNEDEDIT